MSNTSAILKFLNIRPGFRFEWVWVAACMVIVLGWAVRLWEYLASRSLWFDEARLALKVSQESYSQLLTEASPAGFLFLAKTLVLVFGGGEAVLRFPSFLAGILALPLYFYFLLRFSSRPTAVIALVPFSVSVVMVRFATEFKPYAGDVLCSLLIALIGMMLAGREITLKKGLILGVLGAVMIWLSYPSVFMLGGVGSVLFLTCLLGKDRRSLRNLCASFLFWGSSFLFLYSMSLKAVASNPVYEGYWGRAFMPFPPLSMQEQAWLPTTFIKMFFYPGMIGQPLLGAAAFLVGAGEVFRRDRRVFWISTLPFLLALLASAVHKYPAEGRLLLFYVPFMYFFMAEGVVVLIGKTAWVPRLFGGVLLGAILWAPLTGVFKYEQYKMYYVEEIKPVLRYVSRHVRTGDVVYVYEGARPAFEYYAPAYGLDQMRSIQGAGPFPVWEDYEADLSRLPVEGRIWFVFSHVGHAGGRSVEDEMLRHLDSRARISRSVNALNASAYLYQFGSGQ